MRWHRSHPDKILPNALTDGAAPGGDRRGGDARRSAGRPRQERASAGSTSTRRAHSIHTHTPSSDLRVAKHMAPSHIHTHKTSTCSMQHVRSRGLRTYECLRRRRTHCQHPRAARTGATIALSVCSRSWVAAPLSRARVTRASATATHCLYCPHNVGAPPCPRVNCAAISLSLPPAHMVNMLTLRPVEVTRSS